MIIIIIIIIITTIIIFYYHYYCYHYYLKQTLFGNCLSMKFACYLVTTKCITSSMLQYYIESDAI